MENNAVDTSFEDRMKEMKEKAKQRRIVTKDKLLSMFNTLKFNSFDFDKVEVNYAGSGDSGAIEDIDFFRKDQNLFSKYAGYSHEPESVTIPKDSPLSDELKKDIHKDSTICSFITYLEDITYDMLEERHGGWEINDGQEGTFTFTFNPKGENEKDLLINHDYTVFTYDSHQHQEEF
tara:strand:+ start:980 stop:1510 length:531 start_codon:yes stop_codon:yes gene_type:complete